MLMLFGVGTHHQLKVANHPQRFKQFLPERIGCSAFVPLGIRRQDFHDVAERELVDVDDSLSDVGKGEISRGPTIPTASRVVVATYRQNAKLRDAALGARNKGTHD